jgi:hypothetical protein
MATRTTRSPRRDREGSLYSLLGLTVGRIPDGPLALLTGCGLTAATLIALFARELWRPGLFFLMTACYGFWAMLDRSPGQETSALRAMRWFAALLGTVSAVASLYFAMELALKSLKVQ